MLSVLLIALVAVPFATCTSIDEANDAGMAMSASLKADLQLVRQEHEQMHEVVASALSSEVSSSQRREALVQLGDLYFYGNETLLASVNGTRALQFYAAAAEMGDSRAQFHVGVAYSYGMWGFPLDDAKAMLYYYYASLGEDIAAVMALGHRHWYGLAAPNNCESAARYYEVAANKAVELREASLAKPAIYDMPHRRLKSVAETQHKKNMPSDSAIVDYYQFSAEKGDPEATLSLATLYYYGARDLEQDLGKAASLFMRAYELGANGAAYHVGHIHGHGLGVNQDNETAFQFLKEAAQDGSTSAQNELASMYLHGKGTTVNHDQAIALFKSAAKQGSMEAFYNLGVLHMQGLGVGKYREPEYEVAHGYFQVAAHQGHTLSSHKLGHMSLHGIGTTRSCKNAVDSFKLVAERGEWDRLMVSAFKDFKNQNYEAALNKYVVMAQRGYEIAQHNAAYLMDYDYVHVDTVEATVMLYKWAATQGNVDANLKIGDFFYYGKGGHPVDYTKASAHYSHASKRSNAQAMFNLGLMYEHGVGVQQDFHLAKRYFDRAKEVHADAFVPVTLAVWKLKAHMSALLWKRWWDEWMGNVEPTSPANSYEGGNDESASADYFTYFRQLWRQWTSPADPIPPGRTMPEKPSIQLSWSSLMQTDNMVILVLTVLLAIVLYVRAVRDYRREQRQVDQQD